MLYYMLYLRAGIFIVIGFDFIIIIIICLFIPFISILQTPLRTNGKCETFSNNSFAFQFNLFHSIFLDFRKYARASPHQTRDFLHLILLLSIQNVIKKKKSKEKLPNERAIDRSNEGDEIEYRRSNNSEPFCSLPLALLLCCFRVLYCTISYNHFVFYQNHNNDILAVFTISIFLFQCFTITIKMTHTHNMHMHHIKKTVVTG